MVSEVRHRHGNSVTILQWARIKKSIIYVCKQKAPPCYLHSRSKRSRERRHLGRGREIKREEWWDRLDPMIKRSVGGDRSGARPTLYFHLKWGKQGHCNLLPLCTICVFARCLCLLGSCLALASQMYCTKLPKAAGMWTITTSIKLLLNKHVGS